MNALETYTKEISTLCEKHKVKHLYAFGSVLTGKFHENSDVDFIVDFAKIDLADYADNYFDFKFSLEDILQRPVDLLEEKSIKNPYFKQAVDQHKQLIYG